jgi:hypothetical protein
MVEAIGRLYEKLWRRVGGRPWTDIVRDEQKQFLVVMSWKTWLGT